MCRGRAGHALRLPARWRSPCCHACVSSSLGSFSEQLLLHMLLHMHLECCAHCISGAQAWGWVLEMYGFTLACHIVGIPRVDLFLRMMSQPPWDTQLDPYYILHYT